MVRLISDSRRNIWKSHLLLLPLRHVYVPWNNNGCSQLIYNPKPLFNFSYGNPRPFCDLSLCRILIFLTEYPFGSSDGSLGLPRPPASRKIQVRVAPHTSHITPHTSHLTPHTQHLTPHTSHLTHNTSHTTPHTQHTTPHTSHLTCLLYTSPSPRDRG